MPTADRRTAAKLETLRSELAEIREQLAAIDEFHRIKEAELAKVVGLSDELQKLNLPHLKQVVGYHQKVLWTMAGIVAFVGFILPMLGLLIAVWRYNK